MVLFNTEGQRSPIEEEEDELDLSPPVLEEAVNLLLVSKTVMSCLLVLQNRRNTGKSHNSTTTELPTVIHVPSKVCFWNLGRGEGVVGCVLIQLPSLPTRLCSVLMIPLTGSQFSKVFPLISVSCD